MLADRIRGGLYGLLIGDALGVPYEFHPAAQIPPVNEIEMTPPEGFQRAHTSVKPGTWSDDGAQALCLLDSLLMIGHFDLCDFAGRLLAWFEQGLWAVGGRVFDAGIQTVESLLALRDGMEPEQCGSLRPDGKSNGALMRVLPLALWHCGTDAELVADAHRQCLVTHAALTNQVCCALYCLVARGLLDELPFQEAFDDAYETLRLIYQKKPEYLEELEYRLRPEEADFWQGSGSGYVVDSLRSAFMIMQNAESYEEAVRRAVALGNDTDTTACITGGLAGIRFGCDNIPARWMDALRQRGDAEQLLRQLLNGV